VRTAGGKVATRAAAQAAVLAARRGVLPGAVLVARSAALQAVVLVLVAVGLSGCGRTGADAPALTGRTAPAGGFGAVVAEVLPAIVFIQAEATPPRGIEQLLPGVEELAEGPLPIGAGSGVIFRDDGYILTNNHVVQDAERVLVVLHDRRYFEAQVIGRDPSTEVAVVRIPATGLPVARLGDSDAVQLGEWVLAMGSPLGLQFSVTAGIVSGTGRAIGILGAQPDQAAALESFIQTDAALSPGNSGGPLVNAAGEVVGINTAVAAPRGVPAGYGFAIPSDIARRVAEQLIEFGEVRRPYLGLLLMDVSPAVARAHDLPTVSGAMVVQAEPGSPAGTAGLRQGDVIMGIADRAVLTVSDLQARLAQLQVGSTTSLTVLRGGRQTEVRVELGGVRSGVAGG
jgi:S1-C subfamily serine protease